MTQPGGHGNDINLAALWIPVMPETSHMGEEMRKAGREAKSQFEQGFNSGTSPEAMGGSFGAKLQESINKGLGGLELPLGLSKITEKFSQEVDEKVVNKLKGEASQALDVYRQRYDELTAAQARAAEAERQIGLAREAGANKASIMLPLMTEQSRAAKELETAHTNAGVALNNYNTTVGKLGDAIPKAASGSELLAGAMGGLVVVAAQQLVGAIDSVAEHLVEGAVEAFKMGVEGAKEFAEQMIELGETYEHVEHQVIEFSGGTEEHLEELSSHAMKVFGTLDVAGNETGKAMAQFAAMLDAEPGAALDRLTKHFEELQGRYTDMKSADLASIFVAFNTPVEEADSALASLLQSARNSGQDLGQLQSALAGDVSYTLKEAGLNLEQAGAFTGKLLEMGTSGRSVIMGLNTAMKDFGKEGLSFSDGMKLAGQRLEELGDTAEGQDLAEKLFGTRRWAVAKAAVEEYLDIVRQGPNAFDSNGEAIDDFTQKTRTLQNEWEQVKHKVQEAFLPMGLEAVHLASEGLDHLRDFVTSHMDQIKSVVKQGGLVIINVAHDIETFAIGMLDFMAPIADGIKFVMSTAIETLGNFAHVAGEILSNIPGFKDMGNGLIDAAKSAESFGINLDKLEVGKGMHDLADWLRDHQIDVQHAGDEWTKYADKVTAAMDSANTSVGNSVMNQGSAFNSSEPGAPGAAGPGAASTEGTAGYSGGPSFTPGGHPGTPQIGPAGKGFPGAVDQALGGGSPETNRSLAQTLFPWPASEWNAFDTLEMHEAGYDSTAKNPKSGAFGMGQFLGHEHDAYASGYSTDPATQLRTMFQYIKDRYGTPSAAWAQYYQHPGGQGYYQHGGPIPLDPNWAAPGDPGYIDPSTVGQNPYYKGGTPHGLYDLYPGAESGWVPARLSPWFQGQIGGFAQAFPQGQQPGFAGGGGPQGTDTVPAWLTPGEYVWDTDTVAKWGWLIKMLHKGIGFQGGGAVDDVVGTDPQIQFVDQIAKGFQLQLTAGKSGHGTHDIDKGYHDSGEAGDFSNGVNTDQELAFAMYMFEHYGSELAELIYSDPRMPKLIKDGSPVDPLFYGADTLAEHRNHVHVAIKATQAMSDQLSPGNEPLSGGIPGLGSVGGPGSMPGGNPRSGYAGLPGQYGGLGAYGGETYDEQQSTAAAVRDAQQRASDMDADLARKQREIDDLKKQIAEVGQPTKTGALGLPVKLTPDEQKAADDKRVQLQQRLDDATADLARSQRERADQDGKISDATRKQLEAYYKAPPKATHEKATGTEAFSQLGSSLLGGIGESLGFGDLFAKPPWEWGAVKLLTGAASWALGTANAWADEIGKGHTGMTGFQPIAGWDQQGGSLLSGMAGSLGINLPKAALPQPGVSAGPNIVPGIGGPQVGPAPGPAGPVIMGDFQPINVSPNVDPSAILGPVQEQQNSQNATLHGMTGGLPG